MDKKPFSHLKLQYSHLEWSCREEYDEVTYANIDELGKSQVSTLEKLIA